MGSTQVAVETSGLPGEKGITRTDEVWSSYFDDEFSKDDRRVVLIEQLARCLNLLPRSHSIFQLIENDNIQVWNVDFTLANSIFSGTQWKIALEDHPAEAISCTEVAAHKVLLLGTNTDDEAPVMVNARIYNYHESKKDLKNLKSSSLGKLVCVSGIVVRSSIVKPLVKCVQFLCLRCGALVQQQFADGQYAQPSKCTTEGCKSKTFRPSKQEALKVDFQKIRIQELSTVNSRSEARVPRTLECELSQDLVNSCMPGDLVTVCGIVKHMNREMDIGGHGKKSNLYNLYIEANSVVSKRSSGDGNASAGIFHFTHSDLDAIVQYVKLQGSNLFRHLSHSVCPAIYGHELVKAGMVLSLFGGVQKHGSSSNKVPVRGDIHLLVVGDPGLGKSQLLRSACGCAPRGIYVCGNASSAAGLTVAVVKDAMSGDYVFEAGAMVLANGGVCCVDEFDKMPAEHQTLLEAMEQQSVSVAKAGLVANLPAMTSVMAAANPVSGHYNRSKTVNENLKMSAALLSRFDLVFILLDKPDELRDQRLSEHVMALHSAGSKDRSRKVADDDPENFLAMAARQTQQAKDCPRLAERLKLTKDEAENGCIGLEPLPPAQFRKYVAYARQYAQPKLSAEACSILQAFYLQLRQHSRGEDGTPITARQLESLVRLAEARARVELRETVTAQDAQDVVDLMSESLFHRLVDENGRIDVGRSAGMSKSREFKRFTEFLAKLAVKENRPLYSRRELAGIADDIGLNVPNLDDVIEKMNEAGFLLKKGNSKFEVQP